MKFSKEKPNIAIVHEWITNVAGAEKVVLALKEIYPEAPIYTAVYAPEKAKPFNKFEIITSVLQKIPFMKTKRELLVPFTPFAFEQFDLSKYDLVISSTTVAAKGIITKPGTLHVSYCHTPPRYLWEAEIDPRAKKGAFSWLRQNTIHKMRLWDRLAADRVDYFIANSKYIANRIKKYYRRDAAVVYPPVDIENFQPVDQAEIKDYYLFVSRLVDYKRCDLVIDAFNELGLPLVIVGYGPDEKKLKRVAKSNIKFVGGKFGKELANYFAHAKAFVFAAEEDFGIVPVEAMACGRPVIAYGQGGVTESVIDGETGLFFDEQTPGSLVEAVKKFETMKFDSAKIRRRAEYFGKERFKKEMSELISKYIIDYNK